MKLSALNINTIETLGRVPKMTGFKAHLGAIHQHNFICHGSRETYVCIITRDIRTFIRVETVNKAAIILITPETPLNRPMAQIRVFN